MANKTHITIQRGAELRQLFTVQAPTGLNGELQVVDLSLAGLILEWIAKDRVDEPVPKLYKTLDTTPPAPGGIIKAQGQGSCLLILLAVDTIAFPNTYRQLFWEMRVTLPGGVQGGPGPFTVETGDLEIFESVFP